VTNDDIIRRLHSSREPAEVALSRAVGEVRNWRDGAYGLLADLRRNIAAIVSSAQDELLPVTIADVQQGQRGSAVEPELSAGWDLSAWHYDSPPRNSYCGMDYLLLDSRLFRAGTRSYHFPGGPLTPGTVLYSAYYADILGSVMLPGVILPDRAIISLVSSPEPSLARIAGLYARAGLPVPQLPPYPDLSHLDPDGRRLCGEILNENP
jgi:hypothetical protein